MIKPFLTACITALACSHGFSKDVIVSDPAVRDAMIARAEVWLAPSWISNDFQFADWLDVFNGPRQEGPLAVLHGDDVHCQMTESTLSNGRTGKNPKFNCELLLPAAQGLQPALDTDGKPIKLKVKYPYLHEENPEVYGEVVGTRLLWALGFGADSVYYIHNTHCYGCPPNPFEDRRIDPNTMSAPKTFVPTAIERKMPGDEIIYQKSTGRIREGVSLSEILHKLPEDPYLKYQKWSHRDALRLLAVMLQHTDNKSANQRMMCQGPSDANGNCLGRIVMYIQDIGTSFGVRVNLLKKNRTRKMIYQEWVDDPIWSKPEECKSHLKQIFMADNSMFNTRVSEAGRQFLVKLLDGFTAGPEGRKRVEALFATANVQGRASGETVKMWADAFMQKVLEIKYPLGKDKPDFKCPM